MPRLDPPPESARADSMTWKLHSEMVLLAGWGRAILLQLAHPLVAQGVAEHSGFRAEAFGDGSPGCPAGACAFRKTKQPNTETPTATRQREWKKPRIQPSSEISFRL